MLREINCHYLEMCFKLTNCREQSVKYRLHCHLITIRESEHALAAYYTFLRMKLIALLVFHMKDIHTDSTQRIGSET